MTQEILPHEPELAIRRLQKFVDDLLAVTREEALALESKEPRDLKLALARKEDLSFTYESAAAEFRARLAEFETVDKSLVRELQAAQLELQELIDENNKLYKRAKP